MTKKCIYCGAEIADSCVIDFCERCGVQTFGKKMFDAIVHNMENARENQNLPFQTSSDFETSVKG